MTTNEKIAALRAAAKAAGANGVLIMTSDPHCSEYLPDVYKRQSLGCIRLAVVDVKWIYDNCPLGTPVVDRKSVV